MSKKGSILVLVCLGILCCCDDEPSYPAAPFVAAGDLKFVDVPNNYPDSLILTFAFRDGDFDLGLDPNVDIADPYHRYNFFLENNGMLDKVVTKKLYNDAPPIIAPNSGQQGILASFGHVQSKLQSPPPYSCTDYLNVIDFHHEQVLLLPSDTRVLGLSTQIIDTLTSSRFPNLLLLADTFLVEINKGHYNIFVEFLVEQPDGSFKTFDWRQEYCENFDGRFPLLKGVTSPTTVNNGPFKIRIKSSQTGELTYHMMSHGFKPLFGEKNLKIRFSIQDRALNQSNIAETEPILIPK